MPVYPGDPEVLVEQVNEMPALSQLELGSKSGQGHPDQWLGYLQDCGVTLEDKVIIDGKTYVVNDWVEQIERDIHRNPNQEYSWTLMALTKLSP